MDMIEQPVRAGDPHLSSTVSGDQSLDDTLTLREVVGKFWVRRWFLATFIISFAMVGFLTGMFMTPLYTGVALVQVSPVRSGGATGGMPGTIEDGPEAVPTQALVLQSRALAKQTIERLHLDQDPEFLPKGYIPESNDGSSAEATATPAAANKLGTALVDAFLKRLSVAPQPRTNVIEVSFRSSRPTIAAQVPNMLVQIYLDRLTREKNRALAREGERLDNVILPMLRQKMFDSSADRANYDRYLARSDDIHAQMGQARPDADLLSPADVPIKPTSVTAVSLAIIGAGAGGAIAMVLIVVVDLLRGVLRTSGQLEQELGIRCLGSIPMLTKDQAKGFQSLLQQPQDSAFGQALRGIRMSLPTPKRRTSSYVILVTSALPSEGKTWFAASLATTFAADGSSVALVDCDFCRPTPLRLLNGAHAPGLQDHFAGTAELNEICHNIGASGVKYVPAGAAGTAQAAWRLNFGRMLSVIDRLTEDHAFVVLDSAPLLALPETILLARAAHQTVLVVKWQATRAAVARHAVQQLRALGVDPSAVLSMVDVKRAAQYGDTVASVYKQLEGYYQPKFLARTADVSNVEAANRPPPRARKQPQPSIEVVPPGK